MTARKRARDREDEPLMPGHDTGETREVGEDGSAERLPGRPPRTRVRRGIPKGRRTSQTH